MQPWKQLTLPAPTVPAPARSAGPALTGGSPAGPVRSHPGPLCGWRRPFPSQPGGCGSAPSALAELAFGQEKRSSLPQRKLLRQQLSDCTSGGVRAHRVPAVGPWAGAALAFPAPRPPPWLSGEVRTRSPVPLGSTYLSGSQRASKAVPSLCGCHEGGDTSRLTRRRWIHKTETRSWEKPRITLSRSHSQSQRTCDYFLK